MKGGKRKLSNWGLEGLTASTSNILEREFRTKSLLRWVTGRCIVTMSVPFGSKSLSRMCAHSMS